jgi:chromosomal replication initiation ATPase DnaA
MAAEISSSSNALTPAPDSVGHLPITATPGRITVGRVLEATAAHFGMSPADLLSPRRTQPLTRRRQIGMYAARTVTGRSFKFIANKFGRKDHTTAFHAVRAIQARLDAGKVKTTAAVNAITEQLQGGANA